MYGNFDNVKVSINNLQQYRIEGVYFMLIKFICDDTERKFPITVTIGDEKNGGVLRDFFMQGSRVWRTDENSSGPFVLLLGSDPIPGDDFVRY